MHDYLIGLIILQLLMAIGHIVLLDPPATSHCVTVVSENCL